MKNAPAVAPRRAGARKSHDYMLPPDGQAGSETRLPAHKSQMLNG